MFPRAEHYAHIPGVRQTALATGGFSSISNDPRSIEMSVRIIVLSAIDLLAGMQVHLHELQEVLPIARHGSMAAGVHVIADGVQNRLAGRWHPFCV